MKQRPQLTRVVSATQGAAPYVKYATAANIGSHIFRKKPLPPDHNQAAVGGYQLYQLKEPVDFRCHKCKKDSIRADSLAADLTTSRLMCTKCFSRHIRPRNFMPTRVVPFPSLLSWLHYEGPSKVQTTAASNPMERPVEAVVPSGARVAAAGMIADRTGGVSDLPVTPMNASGVLVSSSAGGAPAGPSTAAESSSGGAMPIDEGPVSSLAAIDEEEAVHPCGRVFGGCAHGPLCFFLQAPANSCLPFLMGLCNNSSQCKGVHQPVFDLPPQVPHPPRYQDSQTETAEWLAWREQREKSGNRAEWQLWHNAGVHAVVDSLLPAPAATMTADSVRSALRAALRK